MKVATSPSIQQDSFRPESNLKVFKMETGSFHEGIFPPTPTVRDQDSK
jgi:hypothetical protein